MIDLSDLIIEICDLLNIKCLNGYKEIELNPALSEKADIVKLLFKIFKDCDGLDRVRFGLRALDLSYLRLDISQHYPLIARICHEEVKQ